MNHLEFWGDLLDDDNEKEEKGTTRDQEIRDQTNTNKKKNAEDILELKRDGLNKLLAIPRCHWSLAKSTSPGT